MGGVAVYAQRQIAQQVMLLEKSASAERLWCILHTDCGPYLFGAWYRPPSTELSSIETCEQEHEKLSDGVIGTLLVGDVNVHHLQWLQHSRETTKCGKKIMLAAAQMGLRQIVRQPTRGNYLLDVALSDVRSTSAQVLPRIADHCVVEVSLPLPVPKGAVLLRDGWNFRTADWDQLNANLEMEEWTVFSTMNVDDAATHLSDRILSLAEKSIKKKVIHDRKSMHPWVNDRVLQAVVEKRGAGGSLHESEKAIACSEVITQEYNAWVSSIRCKLRDIPKGRPLKDNFNQSRRNVAAFLPSRLKTTGHGCGIAKAKQIC